MALVVRNPYRGLWNLFGSPGLRIRRFDGLSSDGSDRAWYPKVSAERYEDGLKLRVNLPGAVPEDVDVTVTGEVLTITGQRDDERKIEKEDYEWHEHSHATFSRSVTLPEEVDVEGVHATIEEGVLEIKLPYREPLEPKHIEITSAGDKGTVDESGTEAEPSDEASPEGEAAE